MSKDMFGDRRKEYEGAEAGRRFMKLLPVVARLDGKCFSKFTKGLNRPYDKRMSELMVETTTYLVKETCACIGYTQSDEITLVWYSNNSKSQIYFDGRIQKMVSTLSAMASAYFNSRLVSYLPEKKDALPLFDSRVWTLPNLVEASNAFLWREQDATKNSISMAASSYYSHKELMNKTGAQKQDMLYDKGINWDKYPSFFKRGTFVQKKVVERKYTTEELGKLPEKHAARANKDLTVKRTLIAEVDMPPFSTVKNRVGVIFFGFDPITE
jgi:tRNA(His) guanylyltransferase